MKKKIIIIGAGISGLYLARSLEEKYDVLILEARDRIGGRVFSQNHHDLGPSWIWSHQKNVLKLINALGLELFSQFADGYALYDTKDKVETFVAPPSAPSARVKGSLTQLVNALKNKLFNTEIKFLDEVTSVKEEGGFISVKTQKNNYVCDYVISTLPPRLAAKLEFSPKLPRELESKMNATQTWMGNSAKCVVEFKTAFWREKSLSGFVFSHVGPLGEIHDASTQTQTALFGFVSSNVDMDNFEALLKEQLVRLFGMDLSEIVNVRMVDWKKEKHTSCEQDAKPLSAHPDYGIDASAYSDKILFSSTEFSFVEGGYLEGAIIRADNILKQLDKESNGD